MMISKILHHKKCIVVSRITIFIVLLSYIYFLPLNLVEAQTLNLIVCEKTAGDPCTFGKLIELAQNLINALILISTFLATAVFAYAGVILLTSGGNEASKTKAKEMFTKVLIGYLWILGAWLLVYTITSALLNSGFSVLGAPR